MPRGSVGRRTWMDVYIDMRSRSISVLERLMPSTYTFYPERLEIDGVLGGCSTVLDLGCGPQSIVGRVKGGGYKVGADIFHEYLVEATKNGTHDDLVRSDLTQPCFSPKCVDAAVAFEVIEHLPKEQGLELIRTMESVAKRMIVLTTPNGHVEQEEYDENPYQRHQSAWTADDLRKLGFEVTGLNGARSLRGHIGRVIYKPKVVGEWISFLTQPLVQKRPERAFQLLAVKRLDGSNPSSL